MEENTDLYYLMTSHNLVTYFNNASLSQDQIKIDLVAQIKRTSWVVRKVFLP